LRHRDTLPKVAISNIMKTYKGLISTIDIWEV